MPFGRKESWTGRMMRAVKKRLDDYNKWWRDGKGGPPPDARGGYRPVPLRKYARIRDHLEAMAKR